MDRLKEFIERNVDKRMSEDAFTTKHSGIRVVPTVAELASITDNPMLSEQTKRDLTKLMETRPDLCAVILRLVADASRTMGNCIADRKVCLSHAWGSHKLENMFVYQHTFPNMLEEPISFLGYGPYLTIPRNFRLGLLIHLDLYAKDSIGNVQSKISVGNLWCGYETPAGKVRVSHNSCVLVL